MMSLKKGILILLIGLGMASIVIASDVHVVISEDPIFLNDPSKGVQFDNVNGYITINWKDGTKKGFYYAYATIPGKKLNYEFMLVSVEQSSDKEIKGSFNITRNGVLVAKGERCRVYLLDAPVAKYFKLYSIGTQPDLQKWHISGTIKYRYDY